MWTSGGRAEESETGYRVLVTRTLHQGGSNLRYIRSRVALTGGLGRVNVHGSRDTRTRTTTTTRTRTRMRTTTQKTEERRKIFSREKRRRKRRRLIIEILDRETAGKKKKKKEGRRMGATRHNYNGDNTWRVLESR